MTQSYNMESWDSFYIQFKHTEIGKRLAAALPQKILRQFLSPVLTVASAIEKWNLPRTHTDVWSIRIHGAELPEVADDGRWFGLLPLLLGQDARVQLSYEAAKAKPLPSPNNEVLEILPDIIREDDASEHAPDVTIISHPDFVTRQRQNDIDLMLGRSACVCLFWSAIDVSMEGGWFDHHDMVQEDKYLNPFAIQNDVDGVAAWGRYTVLLKEGKAKPVTTLEELMDLGWIRHHSGLAGYGHPSGQPGKLRRDFQLRSQETGMELMYVLDDLYVSQKNHWLYEFDSDSRQLKPIYEVDAELIEQAPGRGVDILLAYAWAAKIKLAYAFTPMESTSVAQDYYRWLQDCAKRGNPYASIAYARWLEAGYVNEPNPDHAFYEYRRAANAGVATAQYIVGDMAFHDLKDVPLAQEYFTKAAEAGYALAQFNLGLMHLENMVDHADPKTGIDYLIKASEAREVNAMCYLGEWMANQGKLEDAMHYWIGAADMGSVEAASHVLRNAETWKNKLPEKERRAFKKKARTYSRTVQNDRKAVH